MSFAARLAIVPGASLNIAQARLALANRDLARAAGGALALRWDDLGTRDDPSSREKIRQDLRWLGVEWEQEFRQSERIALYEEAADKLRASRRLYPCFENEDELRVKRERRLRAGKSPVYDRAMLKLTPAQRAAAEANGKRPYWRFLLSDIEVTWPDGAAGRQKVKLPTLSDPVLVRADGTIHPTLAGAVDDIDLGIAALARGADEISSSAIQFDLRAALGTNPGRIALTHLPALMDATQGKRARGLEKLTVAHLRQDGIEAAALSAYLGALNAAPRFDSTELLARNRAVLAGLDFTSVAPRLPRGADAAFWHAIRGHIDLLSEARLWWDVAGGEIVPPVVEATPILGRARDLMPGEPWDTATWPAWLAALGLAEDHPDAALLRLALTGEEEGPPMDSLLPLIGPARVAARLRAAHSRGDVV